MKKSNNVDQHNYSNLTEKSSNLNRVHSNHPKTFTKTVIQLLTSKQQNDI